MSFFSTLYVSIPSRGFWFFEVAVLSIALLAFAIYRFQSPRGDFGFLKAHRAIIARCGYDVEFQSPRGDFGFLKDVVVDVGVEVGRGGFNPLAGILVF